MVLKLEDLNRRVRAVAAVTSELNLPAPCGMPCGGMPLARLHRGRECGPGRLHSVDGGGGRAFTECE